MKSCLFFNKEFEVYSIRLQQQHYKQFHGIDKSNFFYKNLFEKKKNVFVPNECVRCDYFCLNSKDRSYQQGSNLSFEARPVNIKRYDGLVYYSVSFDEHQEFYSVFDSDDATANFLNLFELKFILLTRFSIKCRFTIINSQHLLMRDLSNLQIPEHGTLISILALILMNMLRKVFNIILIEELLLMVKQAAVGGLKRFKI